MKIDIKRLHKVHYSYPNTYRREGKSTYCYDSLLRCAQTGYYKNLCYLTNTYKASESSLNDFMEFLDNEKEEYKVDCKGLVTLYNTEINFLGRLVRKEGFDGFIEDFYEDVLYDLTELGLKDNWCKKQGYKESFLKFSRKNR